MIRGDTAVKVPGARRQRFFATSAAVLFLTVQIGLAIHGASHLHPVKDAEDCGLCVVGSHFVAQTASSPNLEIMRPVAVRTRETFPSTCESLLRAPSVRGPPVASV